MLGTLILYILIVDVMRTRADRHWVMRVMLLSALVPLTVGIYQYLRTTGTTTRPGFNRILGDAGAPVTCMAST